MNLQAPQAPERFQRASTSIVIVVITMREVVLQVALGLIQLLASLQEWQLQVALYSYSV